MAITYKMHIMRYEEWELNGRWYCNDTSDIAHDSCMWWLPCRMLGIAPAAFVKLLVDKFHCNHIEWSDRPKNGLLCYSWDKQSEMRQFKNWLNAEARKRNFKI